MPIAPDSRVGPYKIVSEIGAGEMGEVYEASDTPLNRTGAIKILPAKFAEEADRLRRFEHETQAAAEAELARREGRPYGTAEQLLEGIKQRRNDAPGSPHRRQRVVGA